MKHLTILSCLIAISTCSYADEIQTGSYEIQTRTLLPHLEEMRRTITTETACIRTKQIRSLFPILKQPGMVDCRFSIVETTDRTQTYALQCPGKNGAKGTAVLKLNEGKISAELNAKLGGKNMTFSQFSNATLLGECAN